MEITVKRLAEIEAEFGKSITIYHPWGRNDSVRLKFDRYKEVDLQRLNEMLPWDVRAKEIDWDDEGSYVYELHRFKLDSK